MSEETADELAIVQFPYSTGNRLNTFLFVIILGLWQVYTSIFRFTFTIEVKVAV